MKSKLFAMYTIVLTVIYAMFKVPCWTSSILNCDDGATVPTADTSCL